MSNNLRVIYNNLVDSATTTITPSSTSSATTTTANLKLDPKTLVWRSADDVSKKANLITSFASSQIVGGIILPFCNFTSTSSIRVRCFTGTVPTHSGTTVVTTGSTEVADVTAAPAPYQPLGMWSWGSLPLGVNSYSYGGGTYGRVWLPTQVSCTSMAIEITNTASEVNYVEVSRLVIGAYWSPKYNIPFGLSTAPKDSSVHMRTESGDLNTVRGTRYNSMKFDLKWLSPEDRLEFNGIMKGNGLPKPLFISLFPNNETDWSKEQAHQIYGKLSQLGGVNHPIFEMYSSTVDIEEI